MRSVGNVISVRIDAEHASELCTGFGEVGTAAEAVADRAAKEARRADRAVPVGVHLADQLLPIRALGGGGSFRTVAPSRHTRTNAAVPRMFRRQRDVHRKKAETPSAWTSAHRDLRRPCTRSAGLQSCAATTAVLRRRRKAESLRYGLNGSERQV
jgi:RNA 3'-terminal phosphate cyclase